MASTEEPQASLEQDRSYELIEHSDVVGNECQDTATTSTDMEKKVRELEQRLQEKVEKAKAPPALKAITLVLMWIDGDEIRDKHKEDSAVEGEQAPQQTAAEVHEKANESFQKFKLWVNQHKNKKAVLHDAASFSELESACLEPFDDGGANFVRTPDGKLDCLDTFYLSIRTHRSRTEDTAKDNANDKAEDRNRNELMDIWKELVSHCEHIIVWHLNNDDYTLVNKYIKHKLSQHDKLVLLGQRHLAPWIKYLVKKVNGKAEGLAATSEPSTAKLVPSSRRTGQSPEGMQSVRGAALGAKNAPSSEAKSTTTVFGTGSIKPAEFHKEKCVCMGKPGPLTQKDGVELTLFIFGIFGPWAYGSYVTVCYMKTLVLGLFQ